MLKKSTIFFVYSSLFLIFAFPLMAATPDTTTTKQSTFDWEVELKAINEEIQELTKELNEFRKRALNSEMVAQPQMIDSWKEFAKNIRLSEEDEKTILYIKERLQKLNARKNAILKAHTK